MAGKIEIDLEEYEELKEDSNFLAALEAGGVDNWEGYDMARDAYHQGTY